MEKRPCEPSGPDYGKGGGGEYSIREENEGGGEGED
jgi:hypothetical protein